MNRSSKVLLGGIVVVGLVLRFVGLSHDLWEGFVYHPDSAKQMRVVEMFLQGNYFVHIGNADWDGYPYFFPHLIEYLCRVYQFLAQGVFRLLGIRQLVAFPSDLSLFWLARILNALFSTAAIFVAARIGIRSFGIKAGLLAAFFLALSPIDIIGSHYEGADTSAAFFATVAVLFSFRLYDRGRTLDYTLGTSFATCALAAKYHAGMSLIPILVAHALRTRSHGGVLSRSSLLRVGLIAVAGAVSLSLTIPSLLSHFTSQVRDILAFFGHLHAATLSRMPEVASLGKLERLVYSIRKQLPVVTDLIGPAPSAALLVSPLLLWTGGQRLVILLSMPIVYFLIGISSRPGAHPVYHTLITPLAFVIAAAVLATPAPRWWPAKKIYAALTALIAILSGSYLVRSALREDFYFYHSDTRRLAANWTHENVPASFDVYSGAYTFELDPPTDPLVPKVAGSLFASSSIRPTTPGRDALLLKRFPLENDPSLPIFRNPIIELWAETPALKTGFKVPPLPRLPSTNGNELVFLKGPEFYHSEKIYSVTFPEATSRTLVSERQLENALLFVQNGAQPATLSLSFAGHRQALLLGTGQSTWISIDHLRASFPSEKGHIFYEFSASTSAGRARVEIATTAREKGAGFYDQGAFTKAEPWLLQAAAETQDPAVAAEGVISNRLAGTPIPPSLLASIEKLANGLLGPLNPERLDEIYGEVPRYLAALDYFTAQAEAVQIAGFDPVVDPLASNGQAAQEREGGDDGVRSISLELPLLAPGSYELLVRARTAAAEARSTPIRIVLSDSADGVYDRSAELSRLEHDGYVERRFDLEVPYFAPQWRLTLRLDHEFPLVVDQLRIVPNLAANLRSLAKILQFARGEAAAAGRPNTDRYGAIAAIGARKTRMQFRGCDVAFDGGARLTGYRLAETTAISGAIVHLGLRWSTQETTKLLDQAVVWVHFLDERGKIAFQSDRNLVDFLAAPSARPEIVPQFPSIAIPEHVPPGRYRVQVGIHLDGQRLKLRSSDLATAKNGAILSEPIVITR